MQRRRVRGGRRAASTGSACSSRLIVFTSLVSAWLLFGSLKQAAVFHHEALVEVAQCGQVGLPAAERGECPVTFTAQVRDGRGRVAGPPGECSGRGAGEFLSAQVPEFGPDGFYLAAELG